MARSFLHWQQDAPLLMTVFKVATKYKHMRVFRAIFYLLAAGLWKWFGIYALDGMGLTKNLFGYELIKGLSKVSRIAAETEEPTKSAQLMLLL